MSDEDWEKAKECLEAKYDSSESLPIAMNCIATFEKESPTRYISDFRNFLYESKIEDFERQKGKEIIVSTIHKAKGREFDNVFMYLRALGQIDDSDRRVVYVGMTRAKDLLAVHSDMDFSHAISPSYAEFMTDGKDYEKPSEILMQLSHKDVVLSFFKGKSTVIDSLRAGQELILEGDYLTAEICGRHVRVAKLSESFRKTSAQLASDDYFPSTAKVRFIAFWHYEEATGANSIHKSIPIILPDITYRKR